MKNVLLGIIIWTIVVVLLLGAWLLVPTAFWQYLFFLRVPIILGIFLVLLPAIAEFFLPAMLKNLFVLRGTWQLAFIILGASVAAMSVVLVADTIVNNAPARFKVPKLSEIPDLWQYTLAIGLALPITIAATHLSQEELEEKRWGGLLTGILSSVIFFLSFDWIRDWFTNNLSFNSWVIKVIFFLTKHSRQGYIYPKTGLAIDHINALAFLIVLLAVYVFVFIFFKPRPVSNQREASALFYVTLIISISTLLLGNLTFYFDYFRVSVLFFWLVTAGLMYWLFQVDHFFDLQPDTITDKANNLELQDFKLVIDKRLQHQQQLGQEKTLVVVCASGGGIQAAGWTTQVLTGLQGELGTSFTQAIGLISSVSGGSVGTLYYLDRFSDRGYPEDSELDNIFNSSTQDSLDATGWGLTYPDWWRVISLPLFPSIFTPKERDRGIALETDWQGEMKGWEQETLSSPAQKSLATWRKQVLMGTIPIPVFNSTLVEDGRRLLISPMTFGEVFEEKRVDFNSLYGDYDIHAVTAARLSATFPYISPICRATDRGDGNKKITANYPSYHLADGGYFDNSGFVTAVEWLNKWLNPEKDLKIQRVLLLQINPFPRPTATTLIKKDDGLLMTTLGPLLTLFKVRDPILNARNLTEIQIFQEKIKTKNKIDIRYCQIFFPSLNDAPEFYSEEGTYQPPLSWKLTKKEKNAIKKGWQAIVRKPIIQDLKKLWQEEWDM
jgi:hypothetical protein